MIEKFKKEFGKLEMDYNNSRIKLLHKWSDRSDSLNSEQKEILIKEMKKVLREMYS